MSNPRAAIVMNQPSLDKYEALVRRGGYLVVNTSMVNREAKRKDIHVISIPGTEAGGGTGRQTPDQHGACWAGW